MARPIMIKRTPWRKGRDRPMIPRATKNHPTRVSAIFFTFFTFYRSRKGDGLDGPLGALFFKRRVSAFCDSLLAARF
jgi:hypothetical protein